MWFLYLTGLYVFGLLSFHTILIGLSVLSGLVAVNLYHEWAINETQPSYISTAKKKPIIICGDLNVAAMPIDLANPKANEGNPGYSPEERGKFQELLNSGFVDSFRLLHPDKQEYSWWSYRTKARERNIGWRIDYFLVSDFAKDKIIDASILTDVYGSDHCPVALEFDV